MYWQKVSYDAEGRPNHYLINIPDAVQGEVTVDITYNEMGNRSELLASSSLDKLQEKAVYSYNSDGTIDSVIITQSYNNEWGDGQLVSNHYYNAKNQLTAIRLKLLGEDGEVESESVTEYFYKNNVLYRIKQNPSTQPAQAIITYLEFDNKKRPDHLAMIPLLYGYGLRHYVLDFMLPQEHNITLYRAGSGADTLNVGAGVRSSYTYNAQGYPLTQKISQTLHNQSSEYRFTYACD